MARIWTKYLLIPFVVLLCGQALASVNGEENKGNLHEFIRTTHVSALVDVTSHETISRKGPDGIPYSDPVVESEEEKEIDKIISFKLTKNIAFVVPVFFNQSVLEQRLPRVKISIPAVSGKVPQTQSTLYLVFQVFRI